MSILSKIFGHSEDPAGAAKPYLDQIPGVGHKYYDPYRNAGLDASGKTKSVYESLMNDPTGFINKLMEGYEPSKGYQFQKDILGKEMANTAAAGGVAGTPLDQLTQAQGIQGLLSQDMQQYLKNALGVFGTGLGGEEGIAGRGYDASGKLSDIEGGALNQQAGLAFQGAQQKNANRNAWINALTKALGMGAGFALGGAPGMFMGNALTSDMYGGG